MISSERTFDTRHSNRNNLLLLQLSFLCNGCLRHVWERISPTPLRIWKEYTPRNRIMPDLINRYSLSESGGKREPGDTCVRRVSVRCISRVMHRPVLYVSQKQNKRQVMKPCLCEAALPGTVEADIIGSAVIWSWTKVTMALSEKIKEHKLL